MAYSASKGAINGITVPMARDLGRFGIRVVTIAPGIFMTPLAEKMSDNVKAALAKDSPLNRAGIPSEFAHFVQTGIENTFLTGCVLRIDGGAKLSNQ